MKKNATAIVTVALLALVRQMSALSRRIARLNDGIRESALLECLGSPADAPSGALIHRMLKLEDAYNVRAAWAVRLEAFLNALRHIFNPQPGGAI